MGGEPTFAAFWANGSAAQSSRHLATNGQGRLKPPGARLGVLMSRLHALVFTYRKGEVLTASALIVLVPHAYDRRRALKQVISKWGKQMQSKHEMTDGWAALRKIFEEKPTSSDAWNEASTRFQFIDRLLTECLGWEKPYIDVEYPDGDGGRADFVLGNPRRAVLEAKREAVSFGDLPIGKPSVVRKISPLIAASPNLEAAMKQVLGYCSLLGIQLAIVANGPQLVIFQAQTSYPPPRR